jgi:hypothetical protein
MLVANQIIGGLRSVSRGDRFLACIPFANSAQHEFMRVNDAGDVGGLAKVVPAGDYVYVDPGAGITDWNRVVWIVPGSKYASHFEGRFHVFLRCQEVCASGSPGNIQLQLRTRRGFGGVYTESPILSCVTINDWYLMDFGLLDISVGTTCSQGDIPDFSIIDLWLYSASNSSDIYLYDLWLIPVDEWTGMATDTARNVEGYYSERPSSAVAWGNTLDLDSVTAPKSQFEARLRVDNVLDRTRAHYMTDSTGPLIFQANADQRLWMLSASYFVATGTHTGGNNEAVLTDATGDFINRGVKLGDVVVNTTDFDSRATITGVTETTITGTLDGGTEDDWDTNDEYYIITDNLVSYPEVCYKIRAWKSQRYLAARGEN